MKNIQRWITLRARARNLPGNLSGMSIWLKSTFLALLVFSKLSICFIFLQELFSFSLSEFWIIVQRFPSWLASVWWLIFLRLNSKVRLINFYCAGIGGLLVHHNRGLFSCLKYHYFRFLRNNRLHWCLLFFDLLASKSTGRFLLC